MEPEKTPRNARTGKKNVTIDLEATKTDASATAAEAGIARDAGPDEPFDTARTDNPSIGIAPAESVIPPITEPAPESAATDAEAKAEAEASAAASAFSEEPPHATDRIDRPASRSTSGAGALAAGILGGLIALAAAGGLQYSGLVPSLGPAGNNDEVTQRLSADVEALKAQAANGQGTQLAPLEDRIAALETAAASIGNENGDLPALKAEVKSLTDELAAVKTQIADARQVTDTVKTDLTTRLDAAEQKLDAPASDVQLARAIAVTALKTAIDRGGPFLAELDALKSISPDDAAVAGLAGDATTGVDNRSDLTAAFPDVAAGMLDAVRYNDPDQGIMSRLVDSASALVRVRPVGSIDGEGPDAVVARIENKLTNGDLKGAALEWDALPQEAKTAGAAFKAKLDRRIRVEGLIEAAVSGAMTANRG